MKAGFVVFLSSILAAHAGDPGTVRLYPGYVSKLRCEGRLLVSSIGNEHLVRLEALPRELGCAVLLKPLANQGRTNLVLETSAGTVERLLEVRATGESPSTGDLVHQARGGRE